MDNKLLGRLVDNSKIITQVSIKLYFQEGAIQVNMGIKIGRFYLFRTQGVLAQDVMRTEEISRNSISKEGRRGRPSFNQKKKPVQSAEREENGFKHKTKTREVNKDENTHLRPR